MIDKLDFLVRFWELRARSASMGAPLGAQERIELWSLMQLVTGDLDVPAVGHVERPKNALIAQMIGDGAILRVEVRSVAAGAVLVSSASPVAAGAHMILRVSDPIGGFDYVLPCSVLWVHEAAPVIVALTVDGIPTRTVSIGIPEPRLPMGFAFGRHATSPGTRSAE